jgi:hypothetical protein
LADIVIHTNVEQLKRLRSHQSPNHEWTWNTRVRPVFFLLVICHGDAFIHLVLQDTSHKGTLEAKVRPAYYFPNPPSKKTELVLTNVV